MPRHPQKRRTAKQRDFDKLHSMAHVAGLEAYDATDRQSPNAWRYHELAALKFARAAEAAAELGAPGLAEAYQESAAFHNALAKKA